MFCEADPIRATKNTARGASDTPGADDARGATSARARGAGCAPSTDEVRVGNGRDRVRLLSLHDLDRRTAAYRRTTALIEAIETDCGGSDQLSTGQRAIVQRIALMCALSEDLETRWLSGQAIDPQTYTMLANCQRRLLETVGLRRLPKELNPDDKELKMYHEELAS